MNWNFDLDRQCLFANRVYQDDGVPFEYRVGYDDYADRWVVEGTAELLPNGVSKSFPTLWTALEWVEDREAEARAESLCPVCDGGEANECACSCTK